MCHIHDVPTDEAEFGIDELADRAGVSRRTVRYYVQRGLLAEPTGLGRGKHYTKEHLETLIRIRELQEQGVSLVKIAEKLDPSSVPGPSVQPFVPMQSVWTRVVLADGVELHLHDRRLSDERLCALIDVVTNGMEKE